MIKLKYLIQGYNFNKIPAKIDKEISQDEERAGVIIEFAVKLHFML